MDAASSLSSSSLGGVAARVPAGADLCDVIQAFGEHVRSDRTVFADSLDAERAELFAGIKVEGILGSSVSMVVGGSVPVPPS